VGRIMLFKIPENKQGDKCSEEVVRMLNAASSSMTAWEINFWAVWLESYFKVELEEVVDGLTRDSVKKEHFNILMKEVEKEMGIKRDKKPQREKSDEELGKLKKVRDVENPVRYQQRVSKRAESFLNASECVTWCYSVGRNQFSTSVVKHYIVLYNLPVDSDDYFVSMLQFFVGRIDCKLVISRVVGKIRAVKEVKEIIERNNV